MRAFGLRAREGKAIHAVAGGDVRETRIGSCESPFIAAADSLGGWHHEAGIRAPNWTRWDVRARSCRPFLDGGAARRTAFGEVFETLSSYCADSRTQLRRRRKRGTAVEERGGVPM